MNTPSQSSGDWDSPLVGGSGPAYTPPPRQQPHQPYQQQPYIAVPGYRAAAQVPNPMVWAVLSLLGFWPTGIPALVYASKARSKASTGDFQGALSAAKTARLWCIVSTVIFAVIMLGLIGGNA
ncbi:CD225/dispanin family protein [Streptomyces sp. NPDC001492]